MLGRVWSINWKFPESLLTVSCNIAVISLTTNATNQLSGRINKLEIDLHLIQDSSPDRGDSAEQCFEFEMSSRDLVFPVTTL